MRISDWSSDVCSSDLGRLSHLGDPLRAPKSDRPLRGHVLSALHDFVQEPFVRKNVEYQPIILGFPGGYGASGAQHLDRAGITYDHRQPERRTAARSEEPTSELQSLMRNSYAVFCWKKK